MVYREEYRFMRTDCAIRPSFATASVLIVSLSRYSRFFIYLRNLKFIEPSLSADEAEDKSVFKSVFIHVFAFF